MQQSQCAVYGIALRDDAREIVTGHGAGPQYHRAGVAGAHQPLGFRLQLLIGIHPARRGVGRRHRRCADSAGASAGDERGAHQRHTRDARAVADDVEQSLRSVDVHRARFVERT